MMGFAFANTCEHTFKQHGFFCKKSYPTTACCPPPLFYLYSTGFSLVPGGGTTRKGGVQNWTKLDPQRSILFGRRNFICGGCFFWVWGLRSVFCFARSTMMKKLREVFFLQKPQLNTSSLNFPKFAQKYVVQIPPLYDPPIFDP